MFLRMLSQIFLFTEILSITAGSQSNPLSNFLSSESQLGVVQKQSIKRRLTKRVAQNDL